MSSLQDILNQMGIDKNMNHDVSKKSSKKKDNVRSEYDKEKYLEEKKQKKAILYETINTQSKLVANSPHDFLVFLELAAKLGYTVSNTLLIMAQNPNATILKDSKHWNEQNVYINKGEKGIYILEPSKQFERKDGSIGTDFVPKKIFDIKQTNATQEEKEKYTYLDILSAVVYNSNVPIELVSSESNIPRDVFYFEDENKIYVKDGMNENQQLVGLIRETNLANFPKDGKNAKEIGFIVQSATYMAISKYGVQSNEIEFIKDMEFFDGKDIKEVKDSLSEIKSLFKKLDDGVGKWLYEKHGKEKAKKKSRNDFER